jgi:hypothetical protein
MNQPGIRSEFPMLHQIIVAFSVPSSPARRDAACVLIWLDEFFINLAVSPCVVPNELFSMFNNTF